jgi:hypothetical protein
MQVSALEELLGFLGSLPVFRGLRREVLTSLAVFMRPLDAQPGQVLALAGQAADALLIVQVSGGLFGGILELCCSRLLCVMS